MSSFNTYLKEEINLHIRISFLHTHIPTYACWFFFDMLYWKIKRECVSGENGVMTIISLKSSKTNLWRKKIEDQSGKPNKAQGPHLQLTPFLVSLTIDTTTSSSLESSHISPSLRKWEAYHRFQRLSLSHEQSW